MSSLDRFKCGYCGWAVWRYKNERISHSCLANCDHLFMDNNRNLFIDETHLHKTDSNTAIEIDTADKENIAENFESTAYDNLIENIDEDLIATVKERPALYDYRIPVKERGRKQKDHLWQEVSNYLKEKKKVNAEDYEEAYEAYDNVSELSENVQ
ncbi:uncharacterized protein LOC105206094 isoform X2 [Solenopsis invicta]|uniref:uncharacterized protein LOC105206094 isoform X2 n=1 Tax=Solenopsis invicta TaxID=13686 RepID=UPI00193E41C9|nr:uncharacterized protein LOC105206094 isoform X2 [Solenopsis invicta]